jgi:hydroxymethylglutaryl-CoA lyase
MCSDTVRRVWISEVAPRDGFQVEPNWVDTAQKVRLVDALSHSGIAKIEVSSFVSPKAVPNLRDAEDVFRRIERRPGVTYAALVANRRGAERAIAAGADEINFVMSVSETHNLANVGKSCAESCAEFAGVAALLPRSQGIAINVTLATAFGCPFEGSQPIARVEALVDCYLNLGATSVTLADTTGIANPAQVIELVGRAGARIGCVPLTLHFHNTRGMGLANVLAGYSAGVVRFDAALGGLGGCPFAPDASGNICTEDVAHMFDSMGVATGIALDVLLDAARSLTGLLGHDVPGQVMKAGRSTRRYPAPPVQQPVKQPVKQPASQDRPDAPASGPKIVGLGLINQV